MKKNFAGAPNGISLFPERGGQTATLTGLDLTTEVAPGQIFQKRTNFIDNCKTCNGMKNFNSGSNMKNAGGDGYYDYYSGTDSSGGGGGGSFLSGIKFTDLLKIGSTIYSNEQQIKLAREQGVITAAQAEQAKLQLGIAKQKTEQDKIGSLTIKDKIKAYGLPIAITGGVIILGIATYFFFKRSKKISQ